MQERVHIGFFGCRNVGKSSLVNKITNQDMSIVSNVKGTTTDSVKKAMELLPIGPVLIIDTPGFDDNSELGEKRINVTKKILDNCDIAILVTEANRNFNIVEEELITIIKNRGIPYLIVKNKIDLLEEEFKNINQISYISTLNDIGIEELKNKIGEIANKNKEKALVSDLLKPKDIVILVTPIDESAPKNRLILPQQFAIRDIINVDAIPIVVKETELQDILKCLSKKPKLVITDSQVFEFVNNIVPNDIMLTSFSILMARYKGFLKSALKGVRHIDYLSNNSNILIAEGCTHHRQCNDIGTVKLPKLLNKYTGLKLNFNWTSGNDFPDDLTKYDLVIHCGACMITTNEINSRMKIALEQNIPFTNYGIAISFMKGLLSRSTELFN